LLVNIINKFHYLKVGLAFLLIFIGLKMLLHRYLKEWGFTTSHSLIVIIGILALSIIASLAFPKKQDFDKAYRNKEAGWWHHRSVSFCNRLILILLKYLC